MNTQLSYLADEVSSAGALAVFIASLQEAIQASTSDATNTTLEMFLDAIGRWAAANFDAPRDGGPIPTPDEWKWAARTLYAGFTYE